MGYYGSTRGRYVRKDGLSNSKNGRLVLSLIGIYQKCFKVKKGALDGNLERILEKVVRVKLHCFLIRIC